MGVCFSWIVGIIIVALIGYRTERQLLINQVFVVMFTKRSF